MIAWVLFMIIATVLVLTVPDDLADPFALPTPVPLMVSAVEADRMQEACARFYTIQAGDTLTGISQKTGLSEYAIVYANPPARIALPEGSNLCLPDPSRVPTPAPTLVVDSRWSQSRWTTNGNIHLPATGFGPTRRMGAASPARAQVNRMRWYLPVIGR